MAPNSCMSFREVIKFSGSNQQWKTITIATGGSGGITLKESPSASRGGGYAYRESSRLDAVTRNRYIYWRAQHDTIELVEESLDVDLSGNRLRIRFSDAHIIEAVTITEYRDLVVILVATSASVHRLQFTHPSRDTGLHRSTISNTARSIFYDVSSLSIKSPKHSHNFNTMPGLAYSVHAVAACVTNNGEALFALATQTSSVLLVKLPPYNSNAPVFQHEMKQTSMMQRLWTGIVPSLIRGGEAASYISSLIILPLGAEHFIFSTSHDHKIRMWSCKTQECLLAYDLLELMPDNLDASKTSVAGNGHLLRSCAISQMYHIAVYLNLSDRRQFKILQPCIEDGRYHLKPITHLFAPTEDLIDYQISADYLWTLWNNTEGETVARVAPISKQNHAPSQQWLPVIMELPVQTQLQVPDYQDPRECYVDYIFCPSRFSTHAIIKALKIYQRSLDRTVSTDIQIPTEVLKTEVIDAITMEIQNVAQECELSEEDYIQLQAEQWSKFYSCCVQYEEVGKKSLGLMVDSNTGFVSIIKKMCSSAVRPCSTLEHLYLSEQSNAQLTSVIDVNQDPRMREGVATVMSCMKKLSRCLSDDMSSAFLQDIHHTQSPQDIARSLVDSLLTTDISDDSTDVHRALTDITIQLGTVHDLTAVIGEIMEMLDVEQCVMDSEEMEQDAVETSHKTLQCSHLYRSDVSVSLLSETVKQTVEYCLDLSRDLLLLSTLITKQAHQLDLSLEDSTRVSGELIHNASHLVRIFYLLFWSTQYKASSVTAHTVEQSFRQLEVLHLDGNIRSNLAHTLSGQWFTLLQLFLLGEGGSLMRNVISQSDVLDTTDAVQLWSTVLPVATNTTMQLLWPVGMAVTFPEFLLYQCQYAGLQEYIRLSQQWSQWNTSTNQFFLAMAYINTGESQKALNAFIETVHECASEDFLLRMLQGLKCDLSHSEAYLYLLIINLLELLNLPELVVKLASTAIEVSQDKGDIVAMLWSKLFKHQLELCHYDEAYDAMVDNPDPSRRKDCLRQFVVVLCEKEELQKLIELPYTDLQDEVVNIIESRARTVDLSAHNYYDLLYAFHIRRGNYRKASSVMYECGRRISCEILGLQGLRRQAKCYLAAINCLRLVDPNYAWIVQPAEDVLQSLREPRQTMKHGIDGEIKEESAHPQLAVLELDHLDKEYMLVESRLKLMENDPDSMHVIGPMTAPEETVARLVNVGLLDDAVRLCRIFDLPLTTVLEGLTNKCILLSQANVDSEYTYSGRQWLDHNEHQASHSSTLSTADMAWRLLQHYLELYETNSTRYYKCVTRRIIIQGYTLPTWLTQVYKKTNPAELLRMYLDYDLLSEAAQLTLEYIDALLGKGPEYFGLQSGVQVGSPNVWLPYNSIDQLMEALDQVVIDENCILLRKKLTYKLEDYFTVLQQVSNDAIQQELSKQSTVASWQQPIQDMETF